MVPADLLEVFQDTAVELVDILVAEALHIRTGFLATDTTGTEHHDGPILEVGRKVGGRPRKIPEVPDRGCQRPAEGPHAHLVDVTGVEQHHRASLVQPALQFGRLEFGRRRAGGIDPRHAERDDLLLHLHQHPLERTVR